MSLGYLQSTHSLLETNQLIILGIYEASSVIFLILMATLPFSRKEITLETLVIAFRASVGLELGSHPGL